MVTTSTARRGGEQRAGSTSGGGFRALMVFFLLACGMSWAAWAIPVVPTLGPMLAAVIVTALTTGRAGLRDLVSRIAMWRVPLRWWGVALSPALLLLVATGVLWITGQDLPAMRDFAGFSGPPVLAAVGFAGITLAAATGEEVGWRGFALPRLQRRFSPLTATLLLAPFWWLWHLQFFVAERTLGPGYLVYLPLVTSIAVILTWLYNRTGGSLLLVIVWHGLLNLVGVTASVVAIINILLVVQGVLLLVLELVMRHRAQASILGASACHSPSKERTS